MSVNGDRTSLSVETVSTVWVCNAEHCEYRDDEGKPATIEVPITFWQEAGVPMCECDEEMTLVDVRVNEDKAVSLAVDPTKILRGNLLNLLYVWYFEAIKGIDLGYLGSPLLRDYADRMEKIFSSELSPAIKNEDLRELRKELATATQCMHTRYRAQMHECYLKVFNHLLADTGLDQMLPLDQRSVFIGHILHCTSIEDSNMVPVHKTPMEFINHVDSLRHTLWRFISCMRLVQAPMSTLEWK